MKRHKYFYGNHPSQWGELFVPDSGTPSANRPASMVHHGVVVVIHGGYWRSQYGAELGEPLAKDLAAHGMAAWNLEYRRAGDGGGWPHTFEDVLAGIDHLASIAEEHGLNISNVVALGHSAGGHLALWSAATFNPVRLRGVVALAPVADLLMADRLGLDDNAVQDFLGGGVRNDLDPTHLPAPIMPVSIVHGTTDKWVPIEVSDSYVTAHPTARLIPVPNAGHYEVIDPLTPAWHQVTAELTRFSS